MQRFTSPLENLRVASPCPANWDEMYGNERKRFCASCKLNVYNLSAMTRSEAEGFLINAEGRVCVRYYRRADGTVLTQNCPVGWQKVKQWVSRIATAVFSLIVGFFGGLFAFTLFRDEPRVMTMGSIAVENADAPDLPSMGKIEMKGEAVLGEMPEPALVVGRRVAPARTGKKASNRSYSGR